MSRSMSSFRRQVFNSLQNLRLKRKAQRQQRKEQGRKKKRAPQPPKFVPPIKMSEEGEEQKKSDHKISEGRRKELPNRPSLFLPSRCPRKERNKRNLITRFLKEEEKSSPTAQVCSSHQDVRGRR